MKISLGGMAIISLPPNYRALRRAAPQQTLINDGDYMTDEKTQQLLGASSDLNAELDWEIENEHISFFDLASY